MTAEEKARELVEKFTPLVHQGGMVDMTTVEREMDNAKDCALIAVEEIIEALYYIKTIVKAVINSYDANTEEHLKEEFPKYFSCELQNMDRDLNYWQEVRKAIKLI